MNQLFGIPASQSVAIVRATFPELAALSHDTLVQRMALAEREIDNVRAINRLDAMDALPAMDGAYPDDDPSAGL